MKQHRVLSWLVVIVLLSTLGSASVGALAPAHPKAPQAPATALIQVDLDTHDDLARFEATGLPAYARLQGEAGGYLLAGADPAGQAALAAAGLSFRMLDADVQGAAYYLAYPAPNRDAPKWADYGRLLLDPGGGEGVLLRLSPDRLDDLLHVGVELSAVTLQPKPLRSELAPNVIPAVVDPDPLIQSMIDQVTTAEIYTYTRQLAGELPVWVDGDWYTISTRYTYSGVPIQKATHYMGQTMAGYGLDVEYHVWNAVTNPNVIAERPGSVNPDDIYIIGGHLDAVQTAPGADDNGSGSVATLLAAKILTQYNWGCTLRFGLWTGEEQGLLGSEAYAQRAYQQGENILGYLNLDMIAWNTIGSPPAVDAIYHPSRPETQALAQLFADVVAAYDLDLVPQLTGSSAGNSDHASFWQYGYTAIMGIEDFDDFNPYYHGPGDTPAHTDPDYYTEFVKASMATLAHMSGCLIPGGLGSLDGHVTASDSGAPLPGVTVTAENSDGQSFTATTDASGYYTRTLLSDTYDVTAEGPQHSPATVSGVVVTTGTVTTVDFALDPKGRLYGYVTDVTSGAPLPATVSAAGGPQADADPATGYYELYLDPGTWDVTAEALDYAGQMATLDIATGQQLRHDFALLAAVAVTPDPIHAYVELGQLGAVPGQLENNMATPYDFQFFELPDGGPGLLGSGGPDPFGYVYKDNLEPDGPLYQWVDITSTGTPVTLSDDDWDGPFPIGFTFNFYGTNQTQFYIGSNGFLSFGAGSPATTNQCPLPSSSSPNNLIALMWDDLDPGDTGDLVYYQTFPACPYGAGACLVVQYKNYHHYSSSPPGAIAGTFEAILFDNGNVLFQFQDVGAESGSGSTTGMENGSGNIGLTYGTCNSAGLFDESAVCYQYPGAPPCFSGDVPWFGTSLTAGTVPAGGSLGWTNLFSATAEAGITAPGDYYARLLINPEVLGQPRKLIPVILSVMQCVEVLDVDLAVATPAPVYPGQAVEFSVDLLPDGVTAPYTYTVDGGPEVVAATDPFTFALTFDTPGPHSVDVGVRNCGLAEPVTATVELLVYEPCTAITALDLGVVTPPPFDPGDVIEFSVDVLPDGATTPYTYTVNGAPAAATASDPFTFTLSFAQPGTEMVTVAAWNCPAVDPITATLSVEVGNNFHVYLPIIVK